MLLNQPKIRLMVTLRFLFPPNVALECIATRKRMHCNAMWVSIVDKEEPQSDQKVAAGSSEGCLHP